MLECFLAKLRGAVKSLTIWLNGVGLIVLASWNDIAQSVPQLEQFVSAETYKLIGGALVVGNILVRFKTKHALQDK